MKRIAFFAAILIFAATLFNSCEDDDNDNTGLNDTDREFMTKAAYANRNEIDFGQMALMRSTNDTVKGFAQMMVTEHTTALSALDSVANQFSFALPGTIDSAHAALKAQLLTLSGIEFDTSYLKGQIDDHTTTINLFQNEISNGNNAQVKNYATRFLPHIQEHLQVADSVKQTVQ
jgi:putative membrane protein